MGINVTILTEGGKNVGFGHITRCTAICEAFEEIGIKPLWVINGDKSVKSLLFDKNFIIFDWIREHRMLIEKIRNSNIVIIDSYLADISLYNSVASNIDLLVSIDDNLRLIYSTGVVINGTFGAERWKFKKNPSVRYLLGSQYIPLRKTFWNACCKKSNNLSRTLLITFGGNDFRNLTPTVLRLVNTKFPILQKKVIIGSAFENKIEIESLKTDNVELIYSPTEETIKKVMMESDFAISAGGQTLYELACIGVPTIAVKVADNQEKNILGGISLGLIQYAGAWNEAKTIINIAKFLEEFIANPPNLNQNFVDGKGAMRVAFEILSIFNGKKT